MRYHEERGAKQRNAHLYGISEIWWRYLRALSRSDISPAAERVVFSNMYLNGNSELLGVIPKSFEWS
jgi:hypothetical protein